MNKRRTLIVQYWEQQQSEQFRSIFSSTNLGDDRNNNDLPGISQSNGISGGVQTVEGHDQLQSIL